MQHTTHVEKTHHKNNGMTPKICEKSRWLQIWYKISEYYLYDESAG